MAGIRAALIDRDGTINEEKGYVHRTEDFELITGSLEALQLLTRHGVRIFVITNQAGIAKGYYSENQFHILNRYMIDYLSNNGAAVEKVLYCPHHPDGIIPQYSRQCLCRKPNTGLIEAVMDEYSYRPDEVVIVGDKTSDIEAGRRMGLTTCLVLTGYGREHEPEAGADWVEPDLLAAAKRIVRFKAMDAKGKLR